MSKRQRVAGSLVLCDDDQTIKVEVDEVQKKIRQRAFEISKSRNHVAREVDDWLAAESEVVVSPPVEVAQRGDEFIIRMPAAGIDPEHLTIMATSERILVKADFRHEHEEDAAIHICEFKSTMLFRSLRFPEIVDLRSLKTEVKDGLLRITALREGASASVKTGPPRKAAVAAKPR